MGWVVHLPVTETTQFSLSWGLVTRHCLVATQFRLLKGILHQCITVLFSTTMMCFWDLLFKQISKTHHGSRSQKHIMVVLNKTVSSLLKSACSLKCFLNSFSTFLTTGLLLTYNPEILSIYSHKANIIPQCWSKHDHRFFLPLYQLTVCIILSHVWLFY